MALNAVLFDYGDTLLSTRMDWARIVPASIAGLERALVPALPGLNHERLRRDFLFLRQAGRKRADSELLETPAVESLRAALGLQGVRDLDEELLQQGVDGFFGAEEACYSVIEGIPEMLRKLKSMGLKLGVVSNATCPRLIRRALVRFDLLGLFDRVVVSAEVGRCKPDPAIFVAALQWLGEYFSRAAMVGDLLDKDIAGAERVGLRSVLVDFFGEGKQAPADGPQPDAVIRRPEELVGICESWMK